MRISNYDKYPATALSGFMRCGWDDIVSSFSEELSVHPVLAIETYVGIHEAEIETALDTLRPSLFIRMRDLYKSEDDVRALTQRFVTDDPIFGYRTALTLVDFFDSDKLAAAKRLVAQSAGVTVVVGAGASLIVPDTACLVFADLARWEHQERMRRERVTALGIDNHKEAFSSQHKRAYFNDWLICDAHKEQLFAKVSYWLDTHIPHQPKLIDADTFMSGIQKTVSQPFRVVPYFAPAPWGGQWMKEVFDLDKEEVNYGWCFDCVPEENSLFFTVNGVRFELPSINVVLLESRALLGEAVESRFGKDFPIRFDFLDTMGGGYLSFQVHPTTDFIRKQFGMNYTQDESYYMMEAKPDATVYLGLRNDIDRDQMSADLRAAARGELVFDAAKYSNRLPAAKHDHFLIPAGTVHCSGPEGVVLEISATPNHFTFKMWDWERLGLNGKPRPINVERGLQVIDWSRDTDYTMAQLVNAVVPIAQGDGWVEEKTGLHVNEFIETRRHRFTTTVKHDTLGGVQVINLVEGEEVIVESEEGRFSPFIVHYAETFIVPAQLGAYTIRPYGLSAGKMCTTLKAFVRV
ncbi:mannose-6-phosphate isomerase [Sphingobacterium psychroaquaticum]|uniref:class I mannose-6-phosphate isomerase n=1 Tax=Sphingobacterium psychroaquaticum TaxID=561061 RepID=UPI0010696C6B|nr:class I mannose-6-phosphate isomerase [Sphingobacterium psychroaquaticum]QBQ41541.1 mannose-6-phosphate isomerase [Sphingobacterium psychroaquaticum]